MYYYHEENNRFEAILKEAEERWNNAFADLDELSNDLSIHSRRNLKEQSK